MLSLAFLPPFRTSALLPWGNTASLHVHEVLKNKTKKVYGFIFMRRLFLVLAMIELPAQSIAIVIPALLNR